MRPYGYETDKHTIRDHEATLLRGLATRVLNGESLRSLTTELNDRGHRTSAGNHWKPNVLRRVLVSDRVAGLTEEGQPADWPPILDRETWDRLKDFLNDPARATTSGPPVERIYLLTGGAACCGLCAKYMAF